MDGIVEIYAEFEGHPFVIENLHRGSIINFRNWFIDEHNMVSARFQTQGILLEMDIDTFNKIAANHKVDLEEKFLRYQSKIAKENKQYALDYIMMLPNAFRNRGMSRAKQEKAWLLRILHKNVVIRRIVEI
jgi:CRP-like cAMP-binding protein